MASLYRVFYKIFVDDGLDFHGLSTIFGQVKDALHGGILIPEQGNKLDIMFGIMLSDNGLLVAWILHGHIYPGVGIDCGHS